MINMLRTGGAFLFAMLLAISFTTTAQGSFSDYESVKADMESLQAISLDFANQYKACQAIFLAAESASTIAEQAARAAELNLALKKLSDIGDKFNSIGGTVMHLLTNKEGAIKSGWTESQYSKVAGWWSSIEDRMKELGKLERKKPLYNHMLHLVWKHFPIPGQ